MAVISSLAEKVFVALLAAALVGATGCGSPVAPTGAERLRPAPSASLSDGPNGESTDDGAGGDEGGRGRDDAGSKGGPTAKADAGKTGGGAGGGEGGGGDAQRPDVVVSPLRIPLPTDQLQGSNFFARLPELEQLISDACSGSQCVSVSRVGEDPTLDPLEKCDTIRRIEGTLYTEANEAHLMVRPGGVITVVVNIRCEDVPPPPDSEVPPEEQPSPEQPAPDPPPPEQSPPQEQAPSGEPVASEPVWGGAVLAPDLV